LTDWIKATELAPLRLRKRLKVIVENIAIALFYVDGKVFALADICVHKGSHLSQGLVFKGRVVCPGHQWAFDLTTGWADQWAKCQPVFPVRVEGDVVYVKLEPQVRTSPPTPAHDSGEPG